MPSIKIAKSTPIGKSLSNLIMTDRSWLHYVLRVYPKVTCRRG